MALAILLALFALQCNLLQTSAKVVVTTKGCGVTKGCFKSPESCSGPDCNYLVTYFTDGDHIYFELTGSLMQVPGAYITMGIGDSQSMDQIYTIGCYRNGSGANVRDGYTPALPDRDHTFVVPANLGVQVVAAEYDADSNRLNCVFNRSRDPGANKFAKDLRGNVSYYLFAASGAIQASGVGYGYHGPNKWSSPSRVYFTQFASVDPAFSPYEILLKLHGSLMLVSWMAMATIGVLLSLHYRITLSNTSLLGSRAWLKLHRVLQITAVVFTIASTIIIIVAVGGLKIGSEGIAAAHPILGIIILSLSVINCVVIFARRFLSIDHLKFRGYISTGHMVLGRLLVVLSAANVVLGLLFDYYMDLWTVYVTGGLIALTVVVEFTLYVHGAYVSNYNSALRNALNRRDEQSNESESTEKLEKPEKPAYISLKNNSFRMGVLVIYVVASIGAVVPILCAMAGFIPYQGPLQV